MCNLTKQFAYLNFFKKKNYKRLQINPKTFFLTKQLSQKLPQNPGSAKKPNNVFKILASITSQQYNCSQPKNKKKSNMSISYYTT